MIRALYITPRAAPDFDFPIAKIRKALRDKEGTLWIDFSGEPDESCEPILRDVFGFHPLAVDDALRETHVAKVDDWGDYLYIVLNAVSYEPRGDGGSLRVRELDAFLGAKFVVTHHDEPIEAIDQVWQACGRDERHTRDGSDHLLYRIVDYLVAGCMPIVEEIDKEIDWVEDQVFSKPTSETLERIFTLKRSLLAMRRVITPQREVLNKLARDDYAVIDRRDRVFFRDVYDHLVRLQDLNESMRDLVSGTLDTYLSVINNRMNEVMKTLTIITTLFMPLSFVVGFFGMNFFVPREPIWQWMQSSVFFGVLGLMVAIPALMFQWMRRRTWV
jgi:magnesium transporter